MLHKGHEFAPGYRLEEFLGKGQFGQVWRVAAPGGTAAAVKFIDLSMGEGQKEYAAIRRVKAIRHANLMPITAIWLLDRDGKAIAESTGDATVVEETLDLSDPRAAAQQTKAIEVVDDADSRYMAVAMLLGGKNLLDHMHECQAEGHAGIPAKLLLRYIEDAAKGLDFLNSAKHDLGEGPVAIQHCDVKPANIVLLGDSAVVCDFGLARILSRAQVTATSAVGTPAYMAPEAIEGRPSSTTDQYALAVTYYQLRTGNLPMASGSMWAILDAHRTGKLDLRRIPPAEQAVLRRATALDWKQRYPTSLDMAEALRDAVARPNQATPEPGGSVDETIGLGGAIEGTVPVDQANAPTVAGVDSTAKSDKQAAASVASSAPAVGGAAQSAVPHPAPIRGRRLAVPAVATGAAALLLIALSLMWFSGDGSELNDAQSTDRAAGAAGGTLDQARAATGSAEGEDKEEHGVVSPAEDAGELRSEAIGLLASDVGEAAARFGAAVEIDPGLAELAPTVVRLELPAPVDHLRIVDGGRHVMIADSGGNICFVDVDSGQLVGTVAENKVHDGAITAIAVSSDGEMAVTSSWDKSAVVWSFTGDAPQAVGRFLGYEESVDSVALHPNFDAEPYVVSATLDQRLYVHRLDKVLWHASSGTLAEIVPLGSMNLGQITPVSVAFTPDAQRVLIRDFDQQRLLEVLWDQLLQDVQGNAASVPRPVLTERSETKRFITADIGNADAVQPIVITADTDGVISLWDVGPAIYSLRHRLTEHTDAVGVLEHAHAAERHLLLSGSSDGTARLWDLERGAPLALLASHSGDVTSGSLSADGRWAASCGREVHVRLHHWASPQRSALFSTGEDIAGFVAIDPRGKWLLAATVSGQLYRWDLRHAQLITLVGPGGGESPQMPQPQADPPTPSEPPDNVAMR